MMRKLPVFAGPLEMVLVWDREFGSTPHMTMTLKVKVDPIVDWSNAWLV